MAWTPRARAALACALLAANEVARTGAAGDRCGSELCGPACRHPIVCNYTDRAPRLISTVAGVLASGGRRGDGGLAADAQLYLPSGAVVDPASRRLYVADTGNHAVRLVDLAGGGISTAVGVLASYGRSNVGWAVPSGALQAPQMMALAPGGYLLYIADTANQVIRTMDFRSGSLQIFAGLFGSAGRAGDGGPATAAQLDNPHGVAAGDAAVYIADTHNHAVRRVDLATGTIRAFAGILGSGGLSGNGGLANQSLLHFPHKLVLDPVVPRMYITEPYNHAVRYMELDTGLLKTVAGVLGIPGAAGDGGLATAAYLNFPYGIDLDARSRQLYVADAGNHAVRLVDLSTGSISTMAGLVRYPGHAGDGTAAEAAQLSSPADVAVDAAARKLYVVDRSNHAVRCVDLAARGLFTTLGKVGFPSFGGDRLPLGESRLHFPRAVAIDTVVNEMFVADTSNQAVRRLAFDSSGTEMSTFMSKAGSLPEVVQELLSPCGVALDTIAQPRRLYIADAEAGVIYSAAVSGGMASVVAGTSSGALQSPQGLAIDPSGRLLYIADAGNHVVRKLDLRSANLTTIAGVLASGGRGGDGGPATSAQLLMPFSVALDSAPAETGRAATGIYIADTWNHAVRFLDFASGRLSTVAGILGSGGATNDGGLAVSAQLYFPHGVAVDPSAGQLFVADTWNHAVRMVDLVTGLMTSLAGVLGVYGSDAGPGLARRSPLHLPMGVSMAVGARRLFVADAGNHAVRMVALTDEARSNFSGFGLV